MRWLKQNVDSFVVLSSIISAVVWMTSQMSNNKEDLTSLIMKKEKTLDRRIFSIEKDVAVIKGVLISKDILPSMIITKEEKYLNSLDIPRQ